MIISTVSLTSQCPQGSYRLLLLLSRPSLSSFTQFILTILHEEVEGEDGGASLDHRSEGLTRRGVEDSTSGDIDEVDGAQEELGTRVTS